MDGSIVPGGGQRNRLFQVYRAGPDPQVTLRAHVILLLADGFTWATTAAVRVCSTATIDRWRGRCVAGGVDGPTWSSELANATRP